MNAKQILEKALGVDLKKPQSIVEAANTALGLNNVTVGCDLESGTASVQLHNGDEVPLLVNQLICL
jgi:hypothetical protein